MKRPNFFILGAPKCGTTSFASWLSAHPEIFMSSPKEPRYFNRDFQSFFRPRSIKEYEQLFEAADEGHLVVGEATTGYLHSLEAVPAILQYNADAKFLVCLRNPVHMVPSLYSQNLKSGIEKELSLERAWALQKERRRGVLVPRTCPDPKQLLYGPICSLGEQMERLFKLVSRERVLVILLDDMKIDPRREYRRALDFLGVGDDGRSHFPVENARQIPRYPRLAQGVRVAATVRKRLGIGKGTGVASIVQSWNNRRAINNLISPEMQEKLCIYFRDDVEKLSKLLGRDLTSWLA
ncbi:sulfotransferase [Nitrosococcus halophilus Nc 4]|uniref:Sulfotransferase n=1 Tax=Nitrosococcus halophilus (strain Nc4) TaxID=472759 RepID=D5C0F1_NITHN|nr:sulfotransferase domain-containing protein [Nitrosococcus halophilus]ADE14477.1 sulfotransferase [Nitrosococcus halophilus Nc 4]